MSAHAVEQMPIIKSATGNTLLKYYIFLVFKVCVHYEDKPLKVDVSSILILVDISCVDTNLFEYNE